MFYTSSKYNTILKEAVGIAQLSLDFECKGYKDQKQCSSRTFRLLNVNWVVKFSYKNCLCIGSKTSVTAFSSFRIKKTKFFTKYTDLVLKMKWKWNKYGTALKYLH